MKITILVLVFVIAATLGFAEIEPGKKYVVTGEQIIAWRTHMIDLETYANLLAQELTTKEIENATLRADVQKWKEKYERARKGFWVGLSSGYPLGAQALTLYQINERFGVYLFGGYNSVWTANLGFMARVK